MLQEGSALFIKWQWVGFFKCYIFESTNEQSENLFDPAYEHSIIIPLYIWLRLIHGKSLLTYEALIY